MDLKATGNGIHITLVSELCLSNIDLISICFLLFDISLSEKKIIKKKRMNKIVYSSLYVFVSFVIF